MYNYKYQNIIIYSNVAKILYLYSYILNLRLYLKRFKN